MIPEYSLDVVVTRGDAVESVHRVSAAVYAHDALIGKARDPHAVTYWRSSSKPFQAMPFVRAGQFDEVGWGVDQLALACASHGGEPEHVALAQRMLADIGMEEGDLACGVSEPLSGRGIRVLRECGCRPSRLHHNCSGKHAAMLARAYTSGWPVAGYYLLEHPVQQSIVEEIERWTGVGRDQMELAVDGCGVVVFGLPLDAMARAYARLADAVRHGDEVPRRVAEAMMSNPFLVGGTDRFDTVLMEDAPGILCKVGAEGVHSAAIIAAGIGIALKVEDGAARAQFPALLTILEQLGALPDPIPPRLAELMRKPVWDSRHEAVGEIVVRASI